MLKKLNRYTVSTVSRPVKIIQFGEGNFLRAFTCWLVDIMNEKKFFDGAIQIVQPLPNGTSDLLNQQDGLYHVVLKGIHHDQTVSEVRCITSVAGAINPYDNYALFLKQAENPNLQFIISNTTEAGICFNEADDSPEKIPQTFPGKLTALLFHRFKFFNESPISKLIILPCELIDKNGDELKNTVLQYAKHWNLPFAFITWLQKEVVFCNTLVDRIVPGYPKDIINEIEEKTGFEDKLVVMGEYFHLWVIEAPEEVRQLFPADRAGLNVKFVDNLTPYRSRKVRILNGAHTAMVPVAYLRGLRTVQEAVEDGFTGKFINELIFQEILPTLDLPREELNEFAHQVIERFKNPFIRHELLSISLNSISKFKVRVLPSLLEYIDRKKELPSRLTYALAALIRFYKGSWNNMPIPLNDTSEVLQFAQSAWQSDQPNQAVNLFLSNIKLWGLDLTTVTGLEEKVKANLQEIESGKLVAS